MRTIKTKVYQFKELDEQAKEKARDWYREGALDYEWWESVYEDAERAGLTITAFDLERFECEGHLTGSMQDSIQMILSDHGKECDTYKLALEFQAQVKKVHDEPGNAEEYEGSCIYDELREEYTRRLCEEYRHSLQREYEYLLSDEQVDESIIANEYEFTKDGERFTS